MSLAIDCQHVCKRFDQKLVLNDICWKIPANKATGILGTSGSGKTTLLRLIAGLEKASNGTIHFSEENQQSIQLTLKRTPKRAPRVGMVFQNLGLWPHLTAKQQIECVLQNVSSDVLKAAKHSSAEALLEKVQVPQDCWNRKPNQLSGGEAQRVAIARALAVQPEILLLDEPLAQLDQPLRGDLLELFVSIAAEQTCNILYVTHHWSEVMTLCDEVGILSQGKLIQQGTTEDVFWHPNSAEVAKLTGPVCKLSLNLLEENLICYETSNGSQSVKQRASENLADDFIIADEQLLVRPQQLSLIPATSNTSWKVMRCTPFESGFRITLSYEDCIIQVMSAEPHSISDQMEIALQKVGKFPAKIT